MSFRDAHALVAGAVRACGVHDDPTSLAAALRKTQPALKITGPEIERCLDPEYFIQVRTVAGGPAPERTSAALAHASSEQRRIEGWIESTEAALNAARARVTRNP